MDTRKPRYLSLLLTVLLVGANLVAVNYLVSGWSTARLDLTEGGDFSITDTTRRILTSLNDNVTIHAYFSERTHRKLAPLVPQVRDLLEEYEAVSRGRVRVEFIDPGDDDEAAQEASERFGVQSTPFRLESKYETGIVNAYFALVVRYADQYERYGFEDLIAIEPTPDGDVDVRLRNLEYDLTRAIKKIVYNVQTTAELFEGLEEPVRLTGIFTPDTLPEIFAEVPDAVRTAAEELRELAGDRFVFETLDPSRDEAARAEVEQRYGLPALSLGFFGDSSFYLYGILEVAGRVEQINLASESVSAATVREAVESALRRGTPGSMRTVGVFAPDPPQIPPQMQQQFQMPPQQPPEFDEIKRFLAQDYQVRSVNLDGPDGIPAEVDTLLIIKPRDLDERQVYVLDQYLMRGGRVAIFAGNYDVDFGRAGLNLQPLDSGLDDWLEHLGLTTEDRLLLDDRNQPLPIPEVRRTPFGDMRSWRMAPYPYLVQVVDDGILDRNAAASSEAVGIYWGSPLLVDEQKLGDNEIIPILQSSERSWTSDDLDAVGSVDYEVPAEGTEPHLIAAAISGRFESYFAGRPVPDSETDPAATEEGEDEVSAPTTFTLERSPETRLLLVGNAEFVSDFVARALGNMDGGFFAENLLFTRNVIDWLNLDNDMIAIRGRGPVTRRLDRTEKPRQMVAEVANYLIPTVLLIGLGAYLLWMRRNTISLAHAGPDAEPAPTSQGRSPRP